jgi:redox-regulated HSP33 family molecular chaperone
MVDTKSKDEVLKLIDAELQGNLHILIDPKKKDSFSQSRINVWKDTIKERIYYYLTEK